MKSKNSDVTQDNSIRGRRNAREGERQRQAATLNESILDEVQESNSELQRKIAALEKKLDEVVADLNNSVEKAGALICRERRRWRGARQIEVSGACLQAHILARYVIGLRRSVCELCCTFFIFHKCIPVDPTFDRISKFRKDMIDKKY